MDFDDSNVTGTYRYKAMLSFVVVDPDGKRWAFLSNGEHRNAADIRFEGERISADVPDWVFDKAKEARKAWDTENERMKRWLAREKAAIAEGSLRPLSEMPVPRFQQTLKKPDPESN